MFETIVAPARVAGQFAAEGWRPSRSLGVRFAALLKGMDLPTFPVGQVTIAFGQIFMLDLQRLFASPDLSGTCKRSVSHHHVALQTSRGEAKRVIKEPKS